MTGLYSSDEALAWADYPIADKEWTAEYEEELRQNQIIQEEMRNRLDGTTPLDEWYVFEFVEPCNLQEILQLS